MTQRVSYSMLGRIFRGAIMGEVFRRGVPVTQQSTLIFFVNAAEAFLGKCGVHLMDGFWRSLRDLTYYPCMLFNIHPSYVDEMHIVFRIAISSICATMCV